MPQADWGDCYELHIAGRRLTAESAARQMLESSPRWVRILMAVRNRLVSIFGLKAAVDRPYRSADMIGMFPVVSRSPGRIVLGFDDRHLDFRIVIDVIEAGGDVQSVGITTLVRRNILLGRFYLAAIMPFHRLIVSQMLSGLARARD